MTNIWAGTNGTVGMIQDTKDGILVERIQGIEFTLKWLQKLASCIQALDHWSSKIQHFETRDYPLNNTRVWHEIGECFLVKGNVWTIIHAVG